MKFSIVVTYAILTVLLLVAANDDADFRGLYRLEGVWRMDTKKGPLFESWLKKGANELNGLSYTLRESDTVVLERVQIVNRHDGIFYIPTVENQNNGQPVSFKLISSDPQRYVFENKRHDYPQRIIYSFVAPDSVVARIEGEKNGTMRASNYYFKRVNLY